MPEHEIKKLIEDAIKDHEKRFSRFGLITSPILLVLIYLAVKYGL
jgi:hypothetical protein